MDPPFDDAFEVRFHFRAGDLHQDPQRVLASRPHAAISGPMTLMDTVRDLIGRLHPDQLELLPDVRAAELDLHVILPYPLAFMDQADFHRYVAEHLRASGVSLWQC